MSRKDTSVEDFFAAANADLERVRRGEKSHEDHVRSVDEMIDWDAILARRSGKSSG